MSEIMLNVRDASREIHREIHGSYVDYIVAALSADPETIEELEAALARFLDELNRVFGNLREALQNPAAGLVGPRL